jgi:hypothetical protein
VQYLALYILPYNNNVRLVKWPNEEHHCRPNERQVMFHVVTLPNDQNHCQRNKRHCRPNERQVMFHVVTLPNHQNHCRRNKRHCRPNERNKRQVNIQFVRWPIHKFNRLSFSPFSFLEFLVMYVKQFGCFSAYFVWMILVCDFLMGLQIVSAYFLVLK